MITDINLIRRGANRRGGQEYRRLKRDYEKIMYRALYDYEFPPKYLREKPELLTDAPKEITLQGQPLSIRQVGIVAGLSVGQIAAGMNLSPPAARILKRQCEDQVLYWHRHSFFNCQK